MAESIPKPSSPLLPHTSSPRPPLGIIKTISIARAIFGGACIFTPHLITQMFQLPLPRGTELFPRLFGVRDLVVGELLWLTLRGERTEEQLKQIRRVVWANIAIDSIDVVSTIWEFAMGRIAGEAALVTGGGAAVFAAVGAAGLYQIGW
ncbi:hypothetical protein P152DRAFT_473433 [Eremomyces bilateralis CBS 781.70]|uniref:Uncharacterized protein n=1 Tax=Eremomyces bilateralis CBS 781.70 TaxID=1392243 RepID=A0A6G1G4R0_9PEZI|nr:uncharacterized protein P152DRAFT_473433 [Eremomyces bilateralis CBS 781.70]KAF1812900.1 hypothetical protein P152DRAFT_473433 [Eremomyces bilateralis CBS 781.70]